MQRLFVLSVILALAGLVGCNESDRGGKKDDKTPGSETFTLKGPVTSTTIKQGDKQTIKLTLNRGNKFKQDVTLSADAPKGLKVDIQPGTVKASDKETAEATITADKDAPIGEHKITITGTPKEGNPTKIDATVKVEKKGD